LWWWLWWRVGGAICPLSFSMVVGKPLNSSPDPPPVVLLFSFSFSSITVVSIFAALSEFGLFHYNSKIK
jgi:hypothetical protein